MSETFSSHVPLSMSNDSAMYIKSITPYTLKFKFPAGTSRGIYTEHPVQYIEVADAHNPAHVGMGEYAPLPDLSPDTSSAMLFAMETAIWHYHAQSKFLSVLPHGYVLHHDSIERKGMDTLPTHAEIQSFSIPINGLIWMGDYDTMKQRIEEKLSAGFRCLKLKIGAINFSDEIALLRQIRHRFPREVVELRVDANGAFQAGDDALRKLDILSQLDLHSIEQPIRAGQWQEMAKLCRNTPLPIALDEELIPNPSFATYTTEYKAKLFDEIAPQYIILKPSLHGGLSSCDEWIRLAQQRNIGWWATSALESNVGLNAIAHWVAQYHPTQPQGLGTGQIYENNIEGYPLALKGDELWCKR